MSQKHTEIDNALVRVLGNGYAFGDGTTVFTGAQASEIRKIVEQAHGAITLGPPARASITLTPAGTATAHLVIKARKAGTAGNNVTVTVDSSGSSPSVAVSGNDVTIHLGSTDANNTLAAVKAAIDAAAGVGDNTGTSTRTADTAIVTCEVVGTSTPGSATFAHSTDTLAKTSLSGGTDYLTIVPSS